MPADSLVTTLFSVLRSLDAGTSEGFRDGSDEKEVTRRIAKGLREKGFAAKKLRYPSSGTEECDIVVTRNEEKVWVEVKTLYTQQYESDWITPIPDSKGNSHKFAKVLVSKDCARLTTLRPSDASAIGALLLFFEDSDHPTDDIFVEQHFRIPLGGWMCHNERWLSKTIKDRKFFVQAWYWWKLVGTVPSTVAPS